LQYVRGKVLIRPGQGGGGPSPSWGAFQRNCSRGFLEASECDNKTGVFKPEKNLQNKQHAMAKIISIMGGKKKPVDEAHRERIKNWGDKPAGVSRHEFDKKQQEDERGKMRTRRRGR